jgi:methylglyoxal/glyoxal reductase
LKSIQETNTLHNEVKMRWLGLGVYKVQGGDAALHSVMEAIKAGYRSIDTAALYQNEESVGRAIKESGIKRRAIYFHQSLEYRPT